MYEKIKRSDEDFIAIGSVEDDRLIKRMNKKDSSKGEEIKQESKEEVKEEDKGEENTRKRKHGIQRFLVQQANDMSWLVQDQTVLGKDYSNLLIADSLLKTIWFIMHHVMDNEALASPNTNDVAELLKDKVAAKEG
ncbi:hypothetical protein Tco_1337623 [Tanacetum coccineum]